MRTQFMKAILIFTLIAYTNHQINPNFYDFYQSQCKVNISLFNQVTCTPQEEIDQLYSKSLQPDSQDKLFEKYTKMFDKSYCDPSISQYRKGIFKANLQKIVKHNAKEQRKYNMGLTYFTDMHKKEYLKKYANLQVTIPETVQPTEQEKLKTLRTDFDQRQKKLRELNLFKQRIESAQENQRNLKTKNQFQLQLQKIQEQIRQLNSDIAQTQKAIQDQTNFLSKSAFLESSLVRDWSCFEDYVYNQGSCGSCYVFAIQSLIFMHYNLNLLEITTLSPQHYLSCSKDTGTRGCCGGKYQDILEFAKSPGMIERFRNQGYNSTFQFLYGLPIKEVFKKYIHHKSYIDIGLNCLLNTYNDDDCQYQSTCMALNQENIDEGNNEIFCNQFESIFSIKKFTVQSYSRTYSCSSLITKISDGPVAVGIIGDDLQHYTCGTYTTLVSPSSTETMSRINHAMVAVGYHSQKGYLLKDSRGYLSGIVGYIWVSKVQSENAGICNYAFSISINTSSSPGRDSYCCDR